MQLKNLLLSILISIAAVGCNNVTGGKDAITPSDDPALTAAVAEQPTQIPPVSQAWPMFRFDLRNSGETNTKGLASRPELLWSFDTGGVVESSPAIVAGVLYEGTFNNSLLALESSTGKLLWQFPVDGLLRASPAVIDGIVFYGADDNRFYAVDAVTGNELWSFPLGPGGEQSSPAVAGDKVYFGAFDRNVYALEVATGREVWQFTTGAGILSSPAVNNNVVFIGSLDGNLYALNQETGKLRWYPKTRQLAKRESPAPKITGN